MIKQVLFGAATLALVAGVSIAQEAQVTTQQRTTIDRPYGPDSTNTRTTTRTRDYDGDRHAVSTDVIRRTDGDGDTTAVRRTNRTTVQPDGDVSHSTTVQKTTVDR